MALVSANLVKVVNLLWNARLKWYSLGLELGIDETTLKVIRMNNNGVDACFRDYLLKMINPLPSWQVIVKALCQPSVDCKKVASDIARSYNVPLPGNCILLGSS